MWNRNFLPAVLHAQRADRRRRDRPSLRAIHVDFYFAKDAGPPKGSRPAGLSAARLAGPSDRRPRRRLRRRPGPRADGRAGDRGHLSARLHPHADRRGGAARVRPRDGALPPAQRRQRRRGPGQRDAGDGRRRRRHRSRSAASARPAIPAAARSSCTSLGDDGALVVGEARPEVGVYYRDQPAKEPRQRRVASENDFLPGRRLRPGHRRRTATTILDARASQAIFATVEAALESCRTGQPVVYGDVERLGRRRAKPLSVRTRGDIHMTGREIIQALHEGRRVFSLGDRRHVAAVARPGQADRHRLRLRRYRAHAARPADAVVDLPDVSGAGPAAGRAHSVQRSVRGVQGARRRRRRRHRPVPRDGRAGARPGRRGEVAAAQGPPACRKRCAIRNTLEPELRDVPGEAQRRQDPDRQHRERAGDREPARDLLGAGPRRGADRPARPVVQPRHPRAVRPPAVRRGGADDLPHRPRARRRRRHPLLARPGAGDRLGEGRRQPGDAQLRPRRVQPHAEERDRATAQGAQR